MRLKFFKCNAEKFISRSDSYRNDPEARVLQDPGLIPWSSSLTLQSFSDEEQRNRADSNKVGSFIIFDAG